MKKEPTVLHEGFLRVEKHHVGGRDYEILKTFDAAAVWLTDGEDRVLLVRQFRPAVGRHTWEIPAGCLDKAGLSPQQVLAEEIREECELDVAPESLTFLLAFTPQIGHNASTTRLYRTAVDGVEAERERTVGDVDVERIRWWTRKELDEAVRTGRIRDAKTLLAYYAERADSRP